MDVVLPSQCKCGCLVQFNTLQTELNRLIIRHSLSEVLDRLSDQAALQPSSEEYADAEQLWNEVTLHLERATKAALILETLKASRGEPSWL